MGNKVDARLTLTIGQFKERARQTSALQAYLRGAHHSGDFYEMASEVITEIYGPLGSKDFDNISSAAPWFARKQNLIMEILVEIARQGMRTGEKKERMRLAQGSRR